MASDGESTALTPAATAMSLSPVSRLCRARCTATRDEEHAVSTTRLGPRTSRAKERRPAVIVRSRIARHAVHVLESFGLRQVPVLGGRLSHEHTGAAARQRGREDVRVLQCFPDDLEEDPLLGVHGQRLARGDAEEGGIEAVQVVDEPTVPRDGRARLTGLCAVVTPYVEPVLRHGGHGVGVAFEQLPELKHPTRSGKSASHPDDRDFRHAALLHQVPLSDVVSGSKSTPETKVDFQSTP